MSRISTKRSIYWATIVYPESAKMKVNDIKDYFNQRSIGFYLSPLHDQDKDDQGESKKPHYHLLLKFSSLKSQGQVQIICSAITDVEPIIISNFKMYGRYLIHLDNPEKAQYNQDNVISNLDYADFLDKEKRQLGIRKMFERSLNGESISDMIGQCLKDGDFDGIDLIRQNIHLLRTIGQEAYQHLVYQREERARKLNAQNEQSKLQEINHKQIKNIRKQNTKKKGK